MGWRLEDSAKSWPESCQNFTWRWHGRVRGLSHIQTPPLFSGRARLQSGGDREASCRSEIGTKGRGTGSGHVHFHYATGPASHTHYFTHTMLTTQWTSENHPPNLSRTLCSAAFILSNEGMSLNIFPVSPRFLLFHVANSSSVSYISFLMQQIPTLQVAYHLAKPAVLSQHLQKIGLEEEKVETRLRHHDENTSAVYHRRSRCLWVCGQHMGNQWSKSCSLEHSTQNRCIHMISCHIHNSVCWSSPCFWTVVWYNSWTRWNGG